MAKCSFSYILPHDAERALIEKLVTEHLTDKRWKEVFLLVAGLKNNGDQSLELMEAATRKLINTPKLNNLLKWVERATNPNDTDFKYLGKRALCLAIAIANAYAIAYANANAYAIAYAIANANANAYAIAIAIANAYAIAIAYAIKQFLTYADWSQKWQIYQDVNYSELINQLEIFNQQIPDENKSNEVKKAFANRLLQTWFAAFHTTQKAMILSEEEIETLDQYLYANLLMIQCKDAAVRVSNTTWNKIESRMLLPVD